VKVFCITKPGINFGFKFFLQYIATPPPFDVFRVLVNSSKSLIKNKWDKWGDKFLPNLTSRKHGENALIMPEVLNVF